MGEKPWRFSCTWHSWIQKQVPSFSWPSFLLCCVSCRLTRVHAAACWPSVRLWHSLCHTWPTYTQIKPGLRCMRLRGQRAGSCMDWRSRTRYVQERPRWWYRKWGRCRHWVGPNNTLNLLVLAMFNLPGEEDVHTHTHTMYQQARWTASQDKHHPLTCMSRSDGPGDHWEQERRCNSLCWKCLCPFSMERYEVSFQRNESLYELPVAMRFSRTTVGKNWDHLAQAEYTHCLGPAVLPHSNVYLWKVLLGVHEKVQHSLTKDQLNGS